MSLLQALPPGPLDIVGDIHGEMTALTALLGHLGYGPLGEHPEGRTLVFVGDLCDRGPDSPAVLACVAQLVAAGRAVAVLGNHEINLLRDDAKDGAGWYFDERLVSDQPKYAPFARPGDAAERAAIVAFLSRLPIALERADLRVIHAAWCAPQISALRALPAGSARAEYDHWETVVQDQARAGTLAQRLADERAHWPHDLEDGSQPPPFLPAHADRELLKAMLNPLKVLTSGTERLGTTPFYAGGKWRFVERVAWWQSYRDPVPVVVGHYWRRPVAPPPGSLTHEQAGLFGGTPPHAWHGGNGRVFCVDYSVGGRWAARRAGEPPNLRYQLAALRWPERTLLFDDGTRVATSGFGEPHAEHEGAPSV